MDAASFFAAFASNPNLLGDISAFLAQQGNPIQSHPDASARDQDSSAPQGRSVTPHPPGPEATLSNGHNHHTSSPFISSPPPLRSRSQSRSPWDKAPSPSEAPHPSHKSPTPGPSRHRQNPSRDRSASPRRGRSASPHRDRTPPPARQRSPVRRVEYVETSYERGSEGKRGGRKKDGDGQIKRTKIELLEDRKRKSKFVIANGHHFGRKYNCWFNPYSSDSVNHKLCTRIARPSGQVGRGDFLIHEAIGLRDDYDWFLDIRGSIRKAAIEHRPRNLDPKTKAKYCHYSSPDLGNIYQYMYERYPFLFHFRDDTEWDCWAVKDMLQQYLGQANSYRTKRARTRYLRRNASGKNKEGGDEGSDEDTSDDETATGARERQGDYHANMSHRRERPTEPSKAPPVPPRHPHQAGSAKANARDARLADKVTARELERAEASKTMVPAKRVRDKPARATVPTATKKKSAKGKERATSPDIQNTSDVADEDDEDEPTRPVTLKLTKAGGTSKAKKPKRPKGKEPTSVPDTEAQAHELLADITDDDEEPIRPITNKAKGTSGSASKNQASKAKDPVAPRATDASTLSTTDAVHGKGNKRTADDLTEENQPEASNPRPRLRPRARPIPEEGEDDDATTVAKARLSA